MKIEQNIFTVSKGWHTPMPSSLSNTAQLVLVFGETSVIKNPCPLAELRSGYPNARIFGCSTAGEIAGIQVLDDSLVATAIAFESTAIRLYFEPIDNIRSSMQVGQTLARRLQEEGLVHAFILSDGLNVNGSALVAGLRRELPPQATVTGGLSGDKDRFAETLVICDPKPERNVVGVLGFYGNRLKVGYGSFGGWDPFGPERVVTRSQDNILYELDGKSALGLYKQYLGTHAAGLPATGLLFPLKHTARGRLHCRLGIGASEIKASEQR
jgi:hypothetical protein